MKIKSKLKDFLKKIYPIPTNRFYAESARIKDELTAISTELSALKAEVSHLKDENNRLCTIASKINTFVPEHIVVSLTTYQPRFKSVCQTLRTLLNQTLKPNRIIVYLDCSEKDITEEMRSLIERGIEYRYNCENLKSHKKYYFVFKEFPESLVITVDDDILYPVDTVESLYRSYKNHPDCVSARRVHKITFDFDGKINPYGSKWGWECKSETEPSYLLFATGSSGILYPPHCLDERVFDKDTMLADCPNADDVWLKTMELLKGTKVVWAPNQCVLPPFVPESQDVGLCYSNVSAGGNDKHIENMVRLFGNEILKVNPELLSTIHKGGGNMTILTYSATGLTAMHMAVHQDQDLTTILPNSRPRFSMNLSRRTA